ncbi:methyltransferase [Streptomyces sp. NPDC059002]|uniref:methyltransferase n=1 Tax=Streptomyces sp. NPDC059002 TaxID=3346690 RepID=UPI0036BF0D45
MSIIRTDQVEQGAGGGDTGPVPMTVLRELSLSSAGAAALRAAVQVGLPDELGDEPATAGDLARALKVDPDILERLLRTLKHYGIFTETEAGHVHTPASRLLRDDHPESLKFWVLWVTEPWTWELWPRLEKAVRTGKGDFEEVYGTDFFTYLHKEWPESTEVFNKSQTELSRLASDAVADRLDLDGVRTLADIGGGRGFTLATLLEKNPHLDGVLVDLPAAVATPDPRLRPGGALASRSRVLAGDCLKEVPVEADVYLFKSILEWGDDQTVTALRNAARAGRPDSRIVLITNLVDDSPEIRYATGIDLLFLLNTNGKRHTKKGVTALIERAGLQVVGVGPINSHLHAVEAAIPAS